MDVYRKENQSKSIEKEIRETKRSCQDGQLLSIYEKISYTRTQRRKEYVGV